MKRVFFFTFVFILILVVTGLGQSQRQKTVRPHRPEVGDEVLVTVVRKKAKPPRRGKKVAQRKKHFFDEADALFGKRSKLRTTPSSSRKQKLKGKKVRSLTHDPEFENWANRKRKTKPMRRPK